MSDIDHLWCPIVFSGEAKENAVNAGASSDDGEKFNLDFFMSDDAKIPGDNTAIEKETKVKKPRRSTTSTNASMVPANTANSLQIGSSTEVPYISTYEETNNMVKNTIIQVDVLSSEIKSDIDSIRASKSLKGKYTYLTNLNGAAASLLSTKLAAIKELNTSITQAHNLELKRAKDLKEMRDADKNDDARMMDMYNAFINAPMGMYDNKLNMPTIPEMMLGVNDPNSGITGMPLTAGSSPISTVTPEQLRMRMETNPNIEEIVVYDPSTGQKWFDVIDKSTGQSMPNFPKSDPFMLEDISIETRAGIAKNRNLDRVWPLKVVGGVNMSEY